MSLAKHANAFFFAFDVESTVREASAATGLGEAALRTAVSRERKRRIKTNFQPSSSEKQRVAERLKALRDMLPTAKLRRGTMPRGYEIRKLCGKEGLRAHLKGNDRH